MKNSFQYDVVLSFAGEDRSYVERVASFLQSHKTRLFYDEFEQVKLWGKDLYEYLEDIYRNKGQFCVVFISKHYALKAWPTHERKSAQARALESNQEYILPARFDNTEIPGLLPTVHYIDLTVQTPEDFGAMILAKLKVLPPQKMVVASHPGTIRIATVFEPSPLFDVTLSEIQDTALQSMFTIVTDDHGRRVDFPCILYNDFFQRTDERILYEHLLPIGFSTFSAQDSLSLSRKGILQTIQTYKWEQPNKCVFDLEKAVRQTIYSFNFVLRWIKSLSSLVAMDCNQIDVSIEGTIPEGTELFDKYGFVDTQMDVARFLSKDGFCRGAIMLKDLSDPAKHLNRQITRLLNLILNGFEFRHLSVGKKSFARVSSDNIQLASDFLMSKVIA